MHTTARVSFSLFLLTSAAATAYLSSAKLRRDGVLNLYPFPRVGRAHHTWQVPIDDPSYLNTDMKRQLYAFPRVGRGGAFRPDMNQPVDIIDLLLRRDLGISKRESEQEDGMWFGPRLGRSFRQEDDDSSHTNKGDNEPGQLETEIERKKRQIRNQ